MCGILGWQFVPGANLNYYQRAMLTYILADEMESRGRDSFGVAMWNPEITESPEPIVDKDLGAITVNGVDTLNDTMVCDAVLGHTRAATVGAVTRPNSHPFAIGDVLGVHNGSVHNYREMNEKYKRNFDVDSMHIFAHLNDGLDMSELSVYGTIVFARKSEDYRRFWYARTEHGNLEVAKFGTDVDNHSLVVFASTKWALKKIADKCKLEMKMYLIDPKKLYFIEGGVSYDAMTPIDLESRVEKKTSSQSATRSGLYGYNSDGNDDGPGYDARRIIALGELDEKDFSDLVYVSPVPAAIMNTDAMPRVFMGGGVRQVLCTDCNHYASMHISGFCAHPACTRTTVCKNRMPLCEACGDYLIDTIHKESITVPGKVWCGICSKMCDHRMSKKERKTLRKQAKNHKRTANDTVDAAFDNCRCCDHILLIAESRAIGMCYPCRRRYLRTTDRFRALPTICQAANCTSMLFTETDIFLKTCMSCRKTNGITDQQAIALAASGGDNGS